jgi:hypothetical protein
VVWNVGIPTRLWRWNRQSVPEHWHTYWNMKMEQTVFWNIGIPTRLWRSNRQSVLKCWLTYSHMKMEQTVCSEMLAYLLAYEDGTDRVFRNVGIPTRLWRWYRQSVPKCWHLNYRHQGITQKKAYKQKSYSNKRKTHPSLFSRTSNLLYLVTTLYTTSLVPLSYLIPSVSIHIHLSAVNLLSHSTISVSIDSLDGSWQWKLRWVVPNCLEMMPAITLSVVPTVFGYKA